MFNDIDINTVFGVTRDLPKNYVERPYVDGVFKESLKNKQHIVIHGGSKQGKTSLIKKQLQQGDSIRITCSNSWNIQSIHKSILKSAGYKLEGTTIVSATTESTIKASLAAGIQIGPFTL